MSLRLRQLTYFVAIAEEGQFGRAARRLELAQPALSQAMTQLESQLGVRLFERHARGVRLTGAGEALFEKARAAVAAVADAERTAHEHTRLRRHEIRLGFIGTPPMFDVPELMSAFARREPDAAISYRELAFPRSSIAGWLHEVDVAMCWSPPGEPAVRSLALRREPRMLLAARGHRLARRRRLAASDVLEETFPGVDPLVEPRWRAFWQLDEQRGGPAPTTPDRAMNVQEVLAIIASGRAVATVPAGPARVLVAALKRVLAIPLADVSPAELALVWRSDEDNRLVASLLATAQQLPQGRRSPAYA